MIFWKTPKGEELTFGEFMSKWKKGMEDAAILMSPLKQVQGQIRFTKIIVIGLILGLAVSIYKFKDFWWVFVILFGALGNTLFTLVGLVQRRKQLETMDNLLNPLETLMKASKGGKQSE